MGCWSFEIFCDDCALDALEELLEAEDVNELVEQMLYFEDGYVGYDEGVRALVAAALIDGAINGLDFELIAEGEPMEEVVNLAAMLDRDNAELLAEPAIDAIDTVLSDDSELFELWRENQALFPKWKRMLGAVKERLSNI